MELVLVLLGLLLSVFCIDFYRTYARSWSLRMVLILRVAEVWVALICGYLFALFVGFAPWGAVLSGLAAAIATFLIVFSCCDKGLFRDIINAELVELVDVMERWKSNFLRDVKDARESVKKNLEAELAICVDEVGRKIENVINDFSGKLGNLLAALNEMQNELINVLSKVRSEAEAFSGSIKGLSDLERGYSNSLSRLNKVCNILSEKLDGIQPLTNVYAAFEKLAAELRSMLENLANKIAASSTPAKSKKNELLERLVEVLKRIDLDVTIGHGRNEPKLLAKVKDKPVFVAAFRAFTFSEKIRQRRIYLNQLKERDYALAHALDLVIFIGNLANNRIWACIIGLKELEKPTPQFVDTPTCLVEESTQAAQECEKSLQILEHYIKQSQPKITTE